LYNLGGVQGGLFSPRCRVEIESDTHLLAIDTKMAFRVARLLLGIGQSHGHGSGYGYTIRRPEARLEWLAAGVRAAARQIRGKFF